MNNGILSICIESRFRSFYEALFLIDLGKDLRFYLYAG
jgi:hypothetical protein